MDDTERRRVLREHGEDPPHRGRLAPNWVAMADRYAELETDPPDAYDGGVGPEDFAAETVAAEPPELPTVVPERPPRKPRKPAPSIADRIKRARAGAKPKPKAKRVSIAPLVSSAWAGLAGIVMQADRPLGAVLTLEADVAGDVLEDVVKDTFVDPLVQPIARFEAKGKKVAALVLPVVAVAGIEHAQTLPEAQRRAREAFLFPVLEHALMMLDDVAHEHAAERLARTQQDEERRQQARVMARAIFGMEPEPDADQRQPSAA